MGTTHHSGKPQNSPIDDIDPHDLDMVAYWSEPTRRARNAILTVNADMRRNYAALKAELIKNLSPVIVVQNDAKGGKYTLIHKGEQESLHPVGEMFELAKSIAHVPLGTFSIIAPYLKGSETTAWVRPLQDFARDLSTARDQLATADIPKDLQDSSRGILDGALHFIEDSVKNGSFSIDTFAEFTGSVYGDIRTNMYHAAKAQIAGVKKLMTRWRAKVGEEAWKGLYTVVLSIWTTSVLNQNSIIIKQFMDQENVETHLIDLPTAELPADPIFTALDNLARIVQDNVAAEMVFSVDQEVADALKGEEDLLSDEIQKQLACPFQNKPAAQKAAHVTGQTTQ